MAEIAVEGTELAAPKLEEEGGKLAEKIFRHGAKTEAAEVAEKSAAQAAEKTAAHAAGQSATHAAEEHAGILSSDFVSGVALGSALSPGQPAAPDEPAGASAAAAAPAPVVVNVATAPAATAPAAAAPPGKTGGGKGKKGNMATAVLIIVLLLVVFLTYLVSREASRASYFCPSSLRWFQIGLASGVTLFLSYGFFLQARQQARQ